MAKMCQKKCQMVDCIYRMPESSDFGCNYYFVTGETKTGNMPYRERYKVETCNYYQCGVRVRARRESPLATPNNLVVLTGLRTLRANDDKVLKMYESGMNDIDIGKAFGVSASTISRWRKRRGLMAKKQKSIDWDGVEKTIRQGYSFKAVARLYNVELSAIEIFAERKRIHEEKD